MGAVDALSQDTKMKWLRREKNAPAVSISVEADGTDAAKGRGFENARVAA